MTMPWPGNIRELSNFIERQFILNETDILSSVQNTGFPGDDPESAINEYGNSAFNDPSSFNMDKVICSVEASLMQTALKRSRNTNEAAKLLGISQPTFSRKYNKYKKMNLL